jgi:drug/metabolite transporter (DMT)-like permease
MPSPDDPTSSASSSTGRRPALGVLAAILSSMVGGMAAAMTRFLIGATDPVTLGALRFGLGFLCLLPVALWAECRWPARRDWPGVMLLGLMFFGGFFILFNLGFRYTTAGHGSLALATLPLVTAIVAAILGVERLTARRSAGVLIAVGGATFALLPGALGPDDRAAPSDAWIGDLTIAGATLCMALYSIWSRPFIARSSALGVVTVGMGVGGGALTLISLMSGGLAGVGDFGPAEWLGVLYLAPIGAALSFFLWAYALGHATATQVTNTMSVHPLSATLLAAVLLGEPVGIEMGVGIAAVAGGIWLASTGRAVAAPAAAMRPGGASPGRRS